LSMVGQKAPKNDGKYSPLQTDRQKKYPALKVTGYLMAWMELS